MAITYNYDRYFYVRYIRDSMQKHTCAMYQQVVQIKDTKALRA